MSGTGSRPRRLAFARSGVTSMKRVGASAISGRGTRMYGTAPPAGCFQPPKAAVERLAHRRRIEVADGAELAVGGAVEAAMEGSHLRQR